jgi:F-type H+-transporting ATPase subunit epsilon
MSRYFDVNIVSPEESLFSGKAEKLFVSGILGDLEILYGHAPLLTKLKPGVVWVVDARGAEEVLYISGGVLEVQPTISTILADVAIRASDVDEVQAMAAKRRAEEVLQGQRDDIDYAKAQSELYEAVAKLRLLQKIKSKEKH